jgi:hypothetical protein
MAPVIGLGPVGDRALDPAEPMPIGRRHPAPGAIALEEHAVQVEPGLVVADQEQRALDHLAQNRAIDSGAGRLAVLGDLGMSRSSMPTVRYVTFPIFRAVLELSGSW